MIVLLNPDFNCSKNLLSSFVDKVTTGTYNFVSLVLNVSFVGEVSLRVFVITLLSMLVITQFSDQFKGMSKVLQKLFKYFKGTTISTFFSQICLHYN